jgi:protein-S-isoprenylcysteine O-methyltransferase Ste14
MMRKLGRREILSDLLTRGFVTALWTLLSFNLLAEYRRTGHVTGLMLLASEALVVIFTLVRRRAGIVDRSIGAAVVTTLSLIGPPLLRADSTAGLMPDLLTALLSGVGMALVITSQLTLGRSFGLIPANRGVVVKGPYGLVRHPIYLGYVISHVAFVVAHPTIWNIGIFAAADAALIVRALVEERILAGDERYQAYCQRVGWHLVPGIF